MNASAWELWQFSLFEIVGYLSIPLEASLEQNYIMWILDKYFFLEESIFTHFFFLSIYFFAFFFLLLFFEFIFMFAFLSY